MATTHDERSRTRDGDDGGVTDRARGGAGSTISCGIAEARERTHD